MLGGTVTLTLTPKHYLPPVRPRLLPVRLNVLQKRLGDVLRLRCRARALRSSTAPPRRPAERLWAGGVPEPAPVETGDHRPPGGAGVLLDTP